jgi:hypothetical protein
VEHWTANESDELELPADAGNEVIVGHLDEDEHWNQDLGRCTKQHGHQHLHSLLLAWDLRCFKAQALDWVWFQAQGPTETENILSQVEFAIRVTLNHEGRHANHSVLHNSWVFRAVDIVRQFEDNAL